jgi:hypothetical protein
VTFLLLLLLNICVLLLLLANMLEKPAGAELGADCTDGVFPNRPKDDGRFEEADTLFCSYFDFYET